MAIVAGFGVGCDSVARWDSVVERYSVVEWGECCLRTVNLGTAFRSRASLRFLRGGVFERMFLAKDVVIVLSEPVSFVANVLKQA